VVEHYVLVEWNIGLFPGSSVVGGFCELGGLEFVNVPRCSALSYGG
jgi:hypothetical protein